MVEKKKQPFRHFLRDFFQLEALTSGFHLIREVIAIVPPMMLIFSFFVHLLLSTSLDLFSSVLAQPKEGP